MKLIEDFGFELRNIIDKSGFHKPTYDELLATLNDLARAQYGEDVNTASHTPLGKLLELLAYYGLQMIEDIEDLYNSKSIFKSEGQALIDNLADRLITPREATKASGHLTITTEGRVSLKKDTAFRGGNANGLYQTLEQYDFKSAGEYDIFVESLEFGDEGNARAHTIKTIVTPTRNLLSVTNREPFVNGQEKETDEELKDRYERSRSISGSRRIEAIEANILQRVTGVRDVVVLENVEMEEVDGIPPKAIHTIYDGGDGKEVARIVYEKKAAGIRAYGKQTYEFENKRGVKNIIGVTESEDKSVWVKVTTLVARDYDEERGERLIERAVYEYIGGYLNDDKYQGVSMGGTLYITQLEAKIMTDVDGLLDIKVELSSDGEAYERENTTSDSYESFLIEGIEVVANVAEL